MLVDLSIHDIFVEVFGEAFLLSHMSIAVEAGGREQSLTNGT